MQKNNGQFLVTDITDIDSFFFILSKKNMYIIIFEVNIFDYLSPLSYTCVGSRELLYIYI